MAVATATLTLVTLAGCGDAGSTVSAGEGGVDPSAAPATPADAPISTAAPSAAGETTSEPATSAPATTAKTTTATTRHTGKAKPKPALKKPAPHLWPVTRVVDGDTVHVAYRGSDVSVRIIGIDTPETVSSSVPDECGGKSASAAAHRLLDGQKVRLVFDATQGRLDKYGRTLAYVERPGLGDYGKVMIAKGLAAEYTYDTPYKRQAVYQAAESKARAAGRAVWGRCGGFDTPLRTPTPTLTHTPTQAPAPLPSAAPAAPAGNCAPGYSPCVPPYPPDVDCSDVNGPITVTGDDPHGLDRDGDGIACES